METFPLDYLFLIKSKKKLKEKIILFVHEGAYPVLIFLNLLLKMKFLNLNNFKIQKKPTKENNWKGHFNFKRAKYA